VLGFAGIFQHGLWTPDEPREAEIGREMLDSGLSAVPTLGGAPFVEKPPLFPWILAGSYSVFGVSAGRFGVDHFVQDVEIRLRRPQKLVEVRQDLKLPLVFLPKTIRARDYPREGNFRRWPGSTVFRQATVILAPEVRSAVPSTSFAMRGWTRRLGVRGKVLGPRQESERASR